MPHPTLISIHPSDTNSNHGRPARGIDLRSRSIQCQAGLLLLQLQSTQVQKKEVDLTSADGGTRACTDPDLLSIAGVFSKYRMLVVVGTSMNQPLVSILELPVACSLVITKRKDRGGHGMMWGPIPPRHIKSPANSQLCWGPRKTLTEMAGWSMANGYNA